MAYETKPNTGSLFKNDKRESDSHPHAKGSAVIDGVEYWVDAWTNIAQSGNKYQSLKFKPKDAQAGAATTSRRAEPAAFDNDLDDFVPF